MANVSYDFIIIGAGAAGITAAQYGARANLSTACFESTAVGGQIVIVADLENYPGAFPAVNGYEFMDNMKKQAEHFGAKIISENVISVEKKEELFYIKTNKAEYTSYAVLIATGAAHRNLEIPGEKEFTGRGVSYCATCDGPFFKNKRITVIGGGDAACDEANYLARLTDTVTLFHRRDTLRAQAGVAERILKHPNINTMLSYVPLEIRGKEKVESVLFKNVKTGEELLHETDAVFIFVGMIPQAPFEIGVKKDDSGYIITDDNMETSVKGLYCAGDVRAKPFRQVVTAAADGAVAAFCAGYHISELKEQQQ